MGGSLDVSDFAKISVDITGQLQASGILGGMVTAPQLRGSPGYDPSGAVASDAALQTALNTAAAATWVNPVVVIPKGDTVKLVTGVTVPAGVELQVNGVIDGSTAPSFTTFLTAAGTLAASQALVANCPLGQSYCQVTSTSLADGTYVKLQSNALWNTGLDLNYPNGGNAQIGEVLLVRVPTATVKTAVTAGDTTISLNNTQGDARTSYFPIGAPITIGGVDTIFFTGVAISSTTITLSGCTGVGNNHGIGATVTLANGYVAFAGPCVGGPYNTSDSAAIVPVTYSEQPAVTGSGTMIGGGPAAGHFGVLFSACSGPRLSSDLTFVNMADTAVYFRDCIDVSTQGPHVRGGRSSSSDFYGLLFAACQDVTIRGGTFRDVRHSISTGNNAVFGISRRILIDGAHANYTTATSFDSHRGADDYSLVNCHSVDSLDTGTSLRCPSGRIENFLCRRAATRAIWLRNQTTQPSRYVINGFDISDSGDNGIAFRPDTGTFPVLQGTISSATAAPFTITVDTTSQPDGFPAGGGSIVVGEPNGINAEQMVYSSCTATTFVISARAQNGTTAQNFANGSAIMLSSTGTGALTDSVEISDGKILRAGAVSLSVYTADHIRFQGVKISNVTIKDQVFAGAAVQIYNADHCDIDVTVLGHPATQKMVQLINCSHVRVKLNGKFVSQSSGIGISFESGCFKCEAIYPSVENAGTGVIADASCTNCTALTGNGLKGATTRVSFPTAAGHYWNQSYKQVLAPNIAATGPTTQTIIAGTVYIGRLELDQPTLFAGTANIFVTTASSSGTDTIEVAILDQALDVTPIATSGAVAGLLNSTGHKVLSLGALELERGTYWVAVYAPVTTSAVGMNCVTIGATTTGAPWNTGSQALKRAILAPVYGGGPGSLISGMPAITSGSAGGIFCPIVAVE